MVLFFFSAFIWAPAANKELMHVTWLSTIMVELQPSTAANKAWLSCLVTSFLLSSNWLTSSSYPLLAAFSKASPSAVCLGLTVAA
jgi:hypothetical protein